MGLREADSQQEICQEMIRFHRWRGKRVGVLLSEVDTEMFTQRLTGSFGSLYIIFKHIVWAEMIWLGRVDSTTVAVMQDEDVNSLIELWRTTAAKFAAIVDDPQQFKRTITYFNTKGEPFENTLFEIVLHMVDHSTYHIGQLMNAIRGLGLDPVPTNMIHYLRATA